MRETGGRAYLLWALKDMLKRYIKRVIKMPISGYLSPYGRVGETVGDFLTGNF